MKTWFLTPTKGLSSPPGPQLFLTNYKTVVQSLDLITNTDLLTDTVYNESGHDFFKIKVGSNWGISLFKLSYQ